MSNTVLENRGTASHFADWVFSVTNPGYRPSEGSSTIADRVALGRFAHERIDQLQFWMRIIRAARGCSSNWELLYADPHDGTDNRVFYASRLIVDGNPMRCKPDVAFRDKDTGRIVIVERKVTGRRQGNIPPDAWPNVRAQLWCYAWIDDWVHAPDVVLACQFYRRRLDTEGIRRQHKRNPWILDYEIRPGWRRSTKGFHAECLRYFHDYGGNFLADGIPT